MDQKKDDLPLTILTPIYNRSKWLTLMISNIKNFHYDKTKLNWYILDSKDGEEDIRLFPSTPEGHELLKSVREQISPITLIYEHRNRKMTIAEKRNHLVKNSVTNWWANMDSDDIYMDASIIDGNEKNVRKTECAYVMCCVCHSNNTCSKELFKEVNVQEAKIEGEKIEILKNIMKDELATDFVDNAEFKTTSS